MKLKSFSYPLTRLLAGRCRFWLMSRLLWPNFTIFLFCIYTAVMPGNMTTLYFASPLRQLNTCYTKMVCIPRQFCNVMLCANMYNFIPCRQSSVLNQYWWDDMLPCNLSKKKYSPSLLPIKLTFPPTYGNFGIFFSDSTYLGKMLLHHKPDNCR